MKVSFSFLDKSLFQTVFILNVEYSWKSDGDSDVGRDAVFYWAATLCQELFPLSNICMYYLI